jgi:small-conductance mechanosensitive channel
MTDVKFPSIKFRHCVLATAIVVTALILPRADSVAAQGSPSGAVASSTMSTPANRLPAAAPSPAGEISAATTVDRGAVTSYLAQVITWYRHLAVEESIARDPAEMLFLADNREMAGEVLKLAFEYARAQASLLKSLGGAGGEPAAATSGGAEPAATAALSAVVPSLELNSLLARRDEAQAEVTRARQRIQQLQATLATARRGERDKLTSELAIAQGDLDLANSRLESIGAMVEFETGAATSGQASTGLDAQIDELERSVPQVAQPSTDAARASAVVAPAAVGLEAEPGGVFGRIGILLRINRNDAALADSIALTNALLADAKKVLAPLSQSLRQIDQQATALSGQASSTDIAAVRRSKAQFEQLTERHKQVLSAILPLAKQMVLLNLYCSNLARWRTTVHQQFNAELRGLILRLLGLAILLAAIFTASFIWRRLTFRYVEDQHRRHQLLQFRRLAVIAVVALVLIFDFANELGALATAMGFAAAGIALTLQNVFLSLAGYFYVSGRFGIRIGDRVQISGISGDVLEIGLFKLTLMEVSAESARQPTGRLVIFPNSVVFQANSNFFKQFPGANFVWIELRLTVAPECDYRLAEKRLIEVVNEVFAHYRDALLRDYRMMERNLDLRIETPRPQSRFELSDAGLELVVRYPAQLRGTAQTADEITRRMLDAIKREPGLKLVARTAPVLQPDSGSAAPSGASPIPTTPPARPLDSSAPLPAAGSDAGFKRDDNQEPADGTPALLASVAAGAAGIAPPRRSRARLKYRRRKPLPTARIRRRPSLTNRFDADRARARNLRRAEPLIVESVNPRSGARAARAACDRWIRRRIAVRTIETRPVNHARRQRPRNPRTDLHSTDNRVARGIARGRRVGRSRAPLVVHRRRSRGQRAIERRRQVALQDVPRFARRVAGPGDVNVAAGR